MQTKTIVKNVKKEILNGEEAVIAKALKMTEKLLKNSNTENLKLIKSEEFKNFLLQLSLLSVRAMREVVISIVDISYVATEMLAHPQLNKKLHQCYDTLCDAENTPNWDLHTAPSKARQSFEKKMGPGLRL